MMYVKNYNQYQEKMKKILKEDYEKIKGQLSVGAQKKFNISEKEINNFISENEPTFNKLLKKENYSEILKSLKRLIILNYRNYNLNDFECCFIYKGKINDYGVKKVYDLALKQLKIDSKNAIKNKVVNEKGQPLYPKRYIYKSGKVINLETIYSRILIGIVKDAETFKLIHYTLNYNVKNLEIPLFKKIKITDNNSNQSSKNEIYVFSTKDSKFEILSDEIKDIKIFDDFFHFKMKASMEFILDSLNEKTEKNNFFILNASFTMKKSTNGYWINFTPIQNNQNEFDLNFNDDDDTNKKDYSGFIDFEPNFRNIVDNAYIILNPYLKNTDEIGFNIYGVWVPKEFRIEEKSKSNSSKKLFPKLK